MSTSSAANSHFTTTIIAITLVPRFGWSKNGKNVTRWIRLIEPWLNWRRTKKRLSKYAERYTNTSEMSFSMWCPLYQLGGSQECCKLLVRLVLSAPLLPWFVSHQQRKAIWQLRVLSRRWCKDRFYACPPSNIDNRIADPSSGPPLTVYIESLRAKM